MSEPKMTLVGVSWPSTFKPITLQRSMSVDAAFDPVTPEIMTEHDCIPFVAKDSKGSTTFKPITMQRSVLVDAAFDPVTPEKVMTEHNCITFLAKDGKGSIWAYNVPVEEYLAGLQRAQEQIVTEDGTVVGESVPVTFEPWEVK